MSENHSRSGFSLMEMLVVTTMIALLMTVSVMSASKARTLARRTKAEAELREMVNAWLQYQAFYNKWPDKVKGKRDADADENLLGPLIDPTNPENPLGVVFFNIALGRGKAFLDPWGCPYRLTFDRGEEKIERTTALETSVFIKFAQQ